VTVDVSGPAALAALFQDLGRGVVPPADGAVSVLRQPASGEAAVLAFTSHIVIAADLEPEWVIQTMAGMPTGDLSEYTNPPFLAAISERLDRRVNCVDLVSYAPARTGAPPLPLTEIVDRSHPRVRRAQRYRSDVRVWATEGGVVVVGRGLGGRLEAAFEVHPDRRDRGLGRALARSALHLVGEWPDEPGVWAQVAPGNAASVRTVLAAGYRPIGSEALLVARRR
jgi:GNAT superfamily N-acetyltransferase